MIRQPVNHSDTSEGFFYQKVYLSHKDVSKPMVMDVNGYVSFSNKTNDWTRILDANQIYVEHRYFGESMPDIVNYEYLNMSNATKDLHAIKKMFAEIYRDGWISVGISKGGLTALSYEYFYPEDMDVTIALSTSVKTSKCDSSFFNFIDSLNKNQGCEEELDAFQRLLLKEKDNVLPYLRNYLLNNDKQYTHLGLEAIYEIAVLEIPFSIWQNGSGCNSIDFSKTDSRELFHEMKTSLNGWFMTDDVFNRIDSYHFQALTELGYYCYPVSRFSGLLETDFEKLTPVQPVEGIKTSYSNELMTQIKEWAQTQGNGIIYISGGNDPYSKFRIVPENGVDAKSILLYDRNHNEVYSNYLDPITRDEITSLIKKWIKH
ncbi:MAG: S28 family serine protease [Brumimicrobium sp.]|nr:S28 family serine protease [Brumimicrobium sp.]